MAVIDNANAAAGQDVRTGGPVDVAARCTLVLRKTG